MRLKFPVFFITSTYNFVIKFMSRDIYISGDSYVSRDSYIIRDNYINIYANILNKNVKCLGSVAAYHEALS